MNTLIFKITEYIIHNNISDISLPKILSKNIYYINEYVNMHKTYKNIHTFLLQPDEYTFHIIKKLVLYDYSFTYNLDNPIGISYKSINEYILNKNMKDLKKLDVNHIQFLEWCKKYNKLNKKKIYFIDKNRIIFR